MSGECNLQLLHEFKENNNDGKVHLSYYQLPVTKKLKKCLLI